MPLNHKKQPACRFAASRSAKLSLGSKHCAQFNILCLRRFLLVVDLKSGHFDSKSLLVTSDVFFSLYTKLRSAFGIHFTSISISFFCSTLEKGLHIHVLFSLFLISTSEHDTLASRISLKFTHESTILYPGNSKFKFQDVITFLFVQTKKQTNDISFVKCKPP